MRLCCLLRRERRGDTQRDESALDLLTQPIQQIRPVVVIADRCPVEGDAALVAAPAAHGGKSAPVSNRADSNPALERAVRKTIDPVGSDLPDLFSDIFTPRDDDIGAQ